MSKTIGAKPSVLVDHAATMRRVRRIHMVGIGGSGMSGIAAVLKGLGYTISGSDLSDGPVLDDLRSLGVVVYIGHKAEQASNSDVVVSSSAVQHDNVELSYARSMSIPVVPRAEMLAEIMRFRHGIAVAGTHGKTTTTSMIVAVLVEGGLDLSYVIGGRINRANRNASLGAGTYLVAEADESDASFLHLQPMCTVLTNLEADHLENYNGDFSLLRKAYVDFLHNLPFYGLAVLCLDDPVLRSLVPLAGRQIRSYGFCDDADYRITDFTQKGLNTYFTVHRPKGRPLRLELGVPGKHNASNATAAVAIAAEYNVGDRALVRALKRFAGVERRFLVEEFVDKAGGRITMVDDYGHHPTELSVTVEVARAVYPGRRLLMVFQPHRYSRLRDLYERFVEVLSTVDFLLVTETYSAGEAEIVGVNSAALCRSIRQRHRVDPILVAGLEEACEQTIALLEPDDVVLIQGAGNIGHLKPMVVAKLESLAYKKDFDTSVRRYTL